MKDNSIKFDRSNLEDKSWYAEDDDGNVTGPYPSEKQAVKALERTQSLHALNLMIRELSEMFDRWEQGDDIESQIIEYATTIHSPGWPFIVFEWNQT